jgi:hypothetical protein
VLHQLAQQKPPAILRDRVIRRDEVAAGRKRKSFVAGPPIVPLPGVIGVAMIPPSAAW